MTDELEPELEPAEPLATRGVVPGPVPPHVAREIGKARSLLSLPTIVTTLAAVNAHVSLSALGRALWHVSPGDTAGLVDRVVADADAIFKDKFIAEGVKYFAAQFKAVAAQGGKSAGLKLPPHPAPGP